MRRTFISCAVVVGMLCLGDVAAADWSLGSIPIQADAPVHDVDFSDSTAGFTEPVVLSSGTGMAGINLTFEITDHSETDTQGQASAVGLHPEWDVTSQYERTGIGITQALKVGYQNPVVNLRWKRLRS